MVILPTRGNIMTTFSLVTAMGLYLIGSLVLVTSAGVQTAAGYPGVIENNEWPKRHPYLADSRQEVAAHTQHDARLNADNTADRGTFPQNSDLPPPGKNQRLQPLTSNDVDSYTKGKLRLMKRDAHGGLDDEGVPFPRNNDLPPPGQTKQLPPLTHEMSQTQAPSLAGTQKNTTDNGNVSSIMCVSTFCLLFCVAISRFLSTHVST